MPPAIVDGPRAASSTNSSPSGGLTVMSPPYLYAARSQADPDRPAASATLRQSSHALRDLNPSLQGHSPRKQRFPASTPSALAKRWRRASPKSSAPDQDDPAQARLQRSSRPRPCFPAGCHLAYAPETGADPGTTTGKRHEPGGRHRSRRLKYRTAPKPARLPTAFRYRTPDGSPCHLVSLSGRADHSFPMLAELTPLQRKACSKST